MRALFSLVGLLVVVVIIMLMAKKQLQAVAPGIVPAASATAGGTAHRAGAVACGAAKGAAGCQSRAGAGRCPRVGLAALIAAPCSPRLRVPGRDDTRGLRRDRDAAGAGPGAQRAAGRRGAGRRGDRAAHRGGPQVVATGYNRPITTHDPTAHAEIVALRHAAQLCGELPVARSRAVRDARAVRDVRDGDDARAGEARGVRRRRSEDRAPPVRWSTCSATAQLNHHTATARRRAGRSRRRCCATSSANGARNCAPNATRSAAATTRRHSDRRGDRIAPPDEPTPR